VIGAFAWPAYARRAWYPNATEHTPKLGHGTVVVAGDGLGVSYEPDANYCGFDSFTYTLNGGSTATVSVEVTCVQTTPRSRPPISTS
jgi:hypothetical protein